MNPKRQMAVSVRNAENIFADIVWSCTHFNILAMSMSYFLPALK